MCRMCAVRSLIDEFICKYSISLSNQKHTSTTRHIFWVFVLATDRVFVLVARCFCSIAKKELLAMLQARIHTQTLSLFLNRKEMEQGFNESATQYCAFMWRWRRGKDQVKVAHSYTKKNDDDTNPTANRKSLYHKIWKSNLFYSLILKILHLVGYYA